MPGKTTGHKVGTPVTFHLKAELKVENPDLTMDEAEAQLRRHGNKILGRNDQARTFLVAQGTRTLLAAEDLEVPAPDDDSHEHDGHTIPGIRVTPCDACSATVTHALDVTEITGSPDKRLQPNADQVKAAMDRTEAALRSNGTTILARSDEFHAFKIRASTGYAPNGTTCPKCDGNAHVVRRA